MKTQLIDALRQHNSELANNNLGILTAVGLSFTDDKSPTMLGGLVLTHDAVHFFTAHTKPQIIYYDSMQKALWGGGLELCIHGTDANNGPYRIYIYTRNKHTDVETLRNGLRSNYVPIRRNLRGVIAFIIVSLLMTVAITTIVRVSIRLSEPLYDGTYVTGDTYVMDNFRITFVSAHPGDSMRNVVYIFYDYETLVATSTGASCPIGRYPRAPDFFLYQGDTRLVTRMSLPYRFYADYGRRLLFWAGALAPGDIIHAGTTFSLHDTTTPITIIRYNTRGGIAFRHELPLTAKGGN